MQIVSILTSLFVNLKTSHFVKCSVFFILLIKEKDLTQMLAAYMPGFWY